MIFPRPTLVFPCFGGDTTFAAGNARTLQSRLTSQCSATTNVRPFDVDLFHLSWVVFASAPLTVNAKSNAAKVAPKSCDNFLNSAPSYLSQAQVRRSLAKITSALLPTPTREQ
ncbi:protein of unknown function [Aminobacter niigataensis]|nr:protein of unknown function [Aminobacter niigataensis]